MDEDISEPTLKLALDTINKKKQALIFANTKRSAEKTAEVIAHKIKDSNLLELSENILTALPKPTKQCERLAACVKKGIAFHHAGLTEKQKELIEENFRKGAIKIIAATPTLAMGVDLPAFRSILKDLGRYGARGLNYIPVLEYMQMAGRAGRPKYDSFGEAISIAATDAEKDKIYETYILGEPEDILSKLAVEPVLRMYVLSLIATEFVNTKDALFGFFSRTFWAHQYKDLGEISLKIENVLELLEEWEFIISSKKDDFVSASDVSDEKYKATTLGKRVAELYIDPLTAHNLVIGLKRSETKHINEFSFLQLISHTLEMRPFLKVTRKDEDKVNEELIEQMDALLENEPTIYDLEYQDFLHSIKTALFFMEWIDEKDEEFLLEEFNIRPGEIKVKLDNADWLLYTLEELARISHMQNLLKEIMRLRLRVEYGVKEELLPLLKLEQIGRVRARKLCNAGIKDIGNIKEASITTLVQLLGKNVAISVKKQVGQESTLEPVKAGKRKGQISLQDY